MGLISTSKTNVNGKIVLLGGWLVLFLATIVAYFPGLKGPFVLDDFGAIAALGNYGGVRDWETFQAFVFGGSAGPTGRPLSLLTFLIDATNWPTDAFPFKRTNLVIHLVNGALLGVLVGQILRSLGYRPRDIRVVTLVTAACWLLHPFLVSTTLYAVQRMAQLSTLFILFGLVSHLYCRAFLRTNVTKAYLLMSVSMGVFTLLAVLSKENGILLPVLIGVIEFTVISSQRNQFSRLNRYWLVTFLVLPSAVIFIYLARVLLGDDFFDVVPPRDFSLYERILTQPRILFDYLQHWFIPKLYTTGIFQDHFIKSTGIVAPFTTLICAVFHVTVIFCAIANRRKWPLFSLACLFFYAAHLLESTTLNLELYFEHRNYLAAVFLFLPIIAAARTRLSRGSFVATLTIVTLCLSGFTRYSTSIWASFPSMVEASAKKAPTSARAQAQYSVLLFNDERYSESLQILDRAIEVNHSPNPLLRVNRLIVLCNLDALQPAEFEKESNILSGLPYDARSITVYTALSDAIIGERCPAIEIVQLTALFVKMLELRQNSDPTSLEFSHVSYLVGTTYAFSGDSESAVKAFEDSLAARPGASHAMMMAAVLATNNFPSEALEFSNLALAQIEIRPLILPRSAPVSEANVRAFQAIVRADLEALQNVDSPRPDE